MPLVQIATAESPRAPTFAGRRMSTGVRLDSGSERERKREGRALPGRRPDVERPPVRLGDRPGDEEPEPGAGLPAPHIRPAELLEDQLLLLGRDPRPVVLDRHEHAA